MELPEKKLEIWENWRNVVFQRVGSHSFAQPIKEKQPSSLEKLLIRIFRQHYENPRYSSIQPPLIGLPEMPLDHRWIELRLIDSFMDWFGRIPVSLENMGLQSTFSVQHLLQKNESCVVIGEPGAGKSTTLKWAARYLIKETRSISLIPIFISLRSFSKWIETNEEKTIYHYFGEQHSLSKEEIEAFYRFMLDVEESRGDLQFLCKVLLDGWDEVPPPSRLKVSQSIDRFEYLLSAIITSRPSGYISSLSYPLQCQISPLSFESMRSLIHEWFVKVKKPAFEELLCQHLDENLSLRDLARNPFVLTLLCAVADQINLLSLEGLPASRAELYQKTIYLIAQYCNSKFRNEGYILSSQEIKKVEQICFELLTRKDVSLYDFNLEEFNLLAEDKGHLFSTLEKARLITLNKEFENLHSFIHATIHEFLASKELDEKLKSNKFNRNDVSFSTTWLQVMLFLSGLQSSSPEAPFWQLLQEFCERSDRFGLILVQVGHLLAEAKIADGGARVIGVDIRPRLWELFVEAPNGEIYADSLIELDSSFAIDQAYSIQENTQDFLYRLILLQRKISLFHPRRRELMALIINFRLKRTEENISSEFLNIHNLGFEFPVATNLTQANEMRNATEILYELSKTKDPYRRRAYRMRLALSRTQEAEDYFAKELENAGENREEIEELTEALATLGTLSARDSLLKSLEKYKNTSQMLLPLLQSLQKMPVDRDSEIILQFLKPDYESEVRTSAALVLGECSNDRTLRYLSDYAHLSENDVNVRKAVLISLGKTGSIAMVQPLFIEGVNKRKDKSEVLIAWNYLFSIASKIQVTRDYALLLPKIEQMVLNELSKNKNINVSVVAQSWVFKNSDRIQKALIELLNPNVSMKIRIAACQSLGKLATVSSKEKLLSLLYQSLPKRDQHLFVFEIAKTLAYISPESILEIDDPIVNKALWDMCLTEKKLIINDKIVKLDDLQIILEQKDKNMENEISMYNPQFKRIRDLKNHIEEDLDLLNKYEEELRLEDDPKRKKKYEKNINDLKTSLANFSGEYSKLIQNLPREGSSSELAMSEFKIINNKLDSIQLGQNEISQSLTDTRSEIIGYFNYTEQKIISELTENINQSQAKAVNELLANLEKVEVSNLGINEEMDSLRNMLQKLEPNSEISIPQKKEISKILNDPQINSKQRLKFIIPIIPFLLQYEQEIELFSGLNLQNLWDRLKDKIRK